jgi:hypothetical protein
VGARSVARAERFGVWERMILEERSFALYVSSRDVLLLTSLSLSLSTNRLNRSRALLSRDQEQTVPEI